MASVNTLRSSVSYYAERTRFNFFELPAAQRTRQQAIRLLEQTGEPKIAVVKQDVQDDLYCCSPSSNALEIVSSTLMRSGPVALFTRFNADFLILETEPDEECQAWAEKAKDLGWYEVSTLEKLKTQIPGREYGHARFAQNCRNIDWSDFDIVISLDVSVPASVTKEYPDTLWCYYIREPKTNAYANSRYAPIRGQDIFLNQTFASSTRSHAPHSLCFPYYLQYYGCLHELLGVPLEFSSPRKQIFLEHQTASTLSPQDILRLKEFGTLDSTSMPDPKVTSFHEPNQKCQRPLRDILRSMLASKYFIACPNHRMVWANAAVEAIAAGALVIGNPDFHIHKELFSRRTSVRTIEEMLQAISHFESKPGLYDSELNRQRRVIDHLCFWRPVRDLLRALSDRRRRL